MAFAKALDTTASALMGDDGIIADNEILEIKVSPHERKHLDIYRSLDDKGQHTVDTVAQMEYERVKKDNK